ncbi:MAG: DUF924 family protein [Marinobacter sp.]|nr:DUF924 family protein [Marinobacter sp.]
MYKDILHFWFQELSQEQWWTKDEALDREIERRFLATLLEAQQGELYTWRASPQGSLAEVIVLDQFSRNIYRDTPAAFQNDKLALVLAQFAIEKGYHHELSSDERNFLYLPFMHSESRKIHEIALDLYTELGNANNLDFERKHKAIIDRFGRYPHRNSILGRASTDEELEFLKQPNSSF